MITNKRLMLAIGISGWALLSKLGKSHKQAKGDLKITRKKELYTWEGEGGNLPPSSGASNVPGNVVAGSNLASSNLSGTTLIN